MWRRTLDLLGIAVEIECHEPSIEGQLAAVLRSYASTDAPPVLRYALLTRRWPTVVRDGRDVSRQDVVADLVPAMELDLLTQVVATAPGTVLHAGAVVDDAGHALAMAGPSGAGKSTLMRALLAAGLRYQSEECVAVRRGSCVGLARALHVEDPALEVPDGFTADAYALRGPSAPRHLRLLHPPEERLFRGAARLDAVLAIAHAPTAPDALEPMTTAEALVALAPAMFRRDLAAVAAAAEDLRGVRCFRLTTRTAEAARHLVGELREELRRER